MAAGSSRPHAEPNGGYARVGQEQEQSQKVKLSLDAMRPDRRFRVAGCGPGEASERAHIYH
jgi:hypothetical protein